MLAQHEDAVQATATPMASVDKGAFHWISGIVVTVSVFKIMIFAKIRYYLSIIVITLTASSRRTDTMWPFTKKSRPLVACPSCGYSYQTTPKMNPTSHFLHRCEKCGDAFSFMINGPVISLAVPQSLRNGPLTPEICAAPEVDQWFRRLDMKQLSFFQKMFLRNYALSGASYGVKVDALIDELLRMGKGDGYLQDGGGGNPRAREIGSELLRLSGGNVILMLCAWYCILAELGQDKATALDYSWDRLCGNKDGWGIAGYDKWSS